MPKLNIKSILQYMLFIAFAAFLLWWVYKDISFEELQQQFASVDKKWIYCSVFISLLSHLSRAERWCLALKPMGYKVSIFPAYLAVLSGYFVNNLIPRMGEFARCALLKRNTNVPATKSFGAVVTERALDAFLLLLLSAIVFFLEFDIIGGFISKHISLSSGVLTTKLLYVVLVAAVLLALLLLLYKSRKRFAHFTVYQKARDFALGLKEGLLSVLKLSRAGIFWFSFHTIMIWVAYFGMTYVLLFATESTQDLGAVAAMAIMLMGGIGVVIPTPGGIGSFHFVMTATLVAYGLAEPQAAFFALIMHTSQLLSFLVLGGGSFFLLLLMGKKETGLSEEATI